MAAAWRDPALEMAAGANPGDYFSAKALFHKANAHNGRTRGTAEQQARDRPSKVLPRLLLSGWSVESNAEVLKTWGVTHVLQVQWSAVQRERDDSSLNSVCRAVMCVLRGRDEQCVQSSAVRAARAC